MPTYEYQCENCNHNYEIEKLMSDPHEKQCPECKKMTLYQVYSPPMVFVKGEASTLGHLADRNTSKMGKYELGDKRGKQEEASKKTEKPKEWWQKGGGATKKDISKMSDKQKSDYIFKGKK